MIYGSTSAGIAAAIQVRRMGKSAVVISTARQIGGMTTSGMGFLNTGGAKAFGGIFHEFSRKLDDHYGMPSSWKRESLADFKARIGSEISTRGEAIRGYEPSVALAVLQGMVEEAKVPVVFDERLDRGKGVESMDGRISAITMESGRRFSAKIFIDATYEGDLMASAGVDFTVGRESNAEYGETLNGSQTRNATSDQFLPNGPDARVGIGDATSGLLPGIESDGALEEGAGDHRLPAYSFLLCLTDDPGNRFDWEKPEGYREEWYELLFRHYESGAENIPWIEWTLPNRKAGIFNNGPVSTDFIGQNHAYPEASYEERERIVANHLLYQRGLFWTMAHHPRSPEALREMTAGYGPAKDEFQAGLGWPEQLFLSETRRMRGRHVMTERHCMGVEVIEDSIGLADNAIDSSHVRRHVDERGRVRNEGGLQVGGFSPFPVSYRSLLPKAGSSLNLLVPVCLSASHVAYGAIRREPVFMVIGQSAGTAAVHAIEEGVNLDSIDFPRLGERLRADGQVLQWIPFEVVDGRVNPASLAGIVVDDTKVIQDGFATVSTALGPFVGEGYRHDGNTGEEGGKGALFIPFIPNAGQYEIRFAYTAHPNRASNVMVNVGHAGGIRKMRIDQRVAPPIDGLFVSLGTYLLNPGQGKSYVEVRNDGADGYVVVDAVQFVRLDGK